MIEVMEALGHVRFRLAGHDRGGRVAYRLALDHPGRLEKLAMLDIVPTWAMWHGMDARLANRAWHWTFLALPAPFPETMIGKDPLLLLRLARPRPAPRPRTSPPSIRARSRTITPSSTIRCASTPPARTIAPAAPPISPTTRPTAPPARRSPARCWRSGARRRHPGRDRRAARRPGANGRPTCAALPSTAGTISPRRTPEATAKALLEFFTAGCDRTASTHHSIASPRIGEPDRRLWHAGSRNGMAARGDDQRLSRMTRSTARPHFRHQGRRRALASTPRGSKLSRRACRFRGPLTVRQFKGGQSNPTYLLETPARRYVLRRKPPGKLLPSAHAVDREFRVISALHAQGFPVAAPLALLRRRRASSARRSMSWRIVDGRVFWEPHMPDADAGRARGGLRRHERHAGAPALVRSGRARACRFRPRRELRRAPDRALVEAVSRLARPKRSRRWSG